MADGGQERNLEWSSKNMSLLSVDLTFCVVSTNRVFGSLWFCRWHLVIHGEKALKNIN